MNRRSFLIAASASSRLFAQQVVMDATSMTAAPVIERAQPGRPHAGKVLAAIQPHADDIPIFAAGTVAKLIREGYRGILIRMTNDDMAGPGTVGDTVLANEKDNDAVARVLGLEKVFNLNYANHQMDKESRVEIRARLIFLFRLMKVDTVISYDPVAHYEENPDHYVTAQSVEAACWMAGGAKDYPEHFAAGLQPHAVREKYYFSRGPQVVNRIVDVTPVIDTKVAVNRVNVAQGPGGTAGAGLRKSLAARGLKLPVLGGDDETASNNYIRHIMLQRDIETGRRHGLAFAEPFHYIGPEADFVEEYVTKNAAPLRQ